MTFDLPHLSQTDPEVAQAIQNELGRQRGKLELIASENFTSVSVLEATGSVMTNKYAEGYPGKRYYGGCEFVDVVEQLAIERAKELFGAEHANVQPHSGSQANAGVYLAMPKPGDPILGLACPQGGPTRRRTRQCAATLWLTGQRRCLSGDAQTWRHYFGHGLAGRRTPDARSQDELQ